MMNLLRYKHPSLLLAVLSLFVAFSARADLKPIRESARYHLIEKVYDRNHDGKPDLWIEESYDGNPIRETRDQNWDGVPDEWTERMTLKNILIEARDTNVDGLLDRLSYRVADERAYQFFDHDKDGLFDECLVSEVEMDGDIPIYGIQKEIPVSFKVQDMSIESFLIYLHAPAAEWIFVVRKLVEKYVELDSLLEGVQKNPDDFDAWTTLLKKTRAYLDLPSDNILPFSLLLYKEENSYTTGRTTSSGELYINTAQSIAFTIEGWLEMVDHEMLHLIQGMKYRKLFQEAEEENWMIHAYLSTYLREAEAYMQNVRRAWLYAPTKWKGDSIVDTDDYRGFQCAKILVEDIYEETPIPMLSFASIPRFDTLQTLFGYLPQDYAEMERRFAQVTVDAAMRKSCNETRKIFIKDYSALAESLFKQSPEGVQRQWRENPEALFGRLEKRLLEEASR